MTEKLSPSELLKKLEGFDYYYEYTDDFRVYKNWNRTRDVRIEQIKLLSDEDRGHLKELVSTSKNSELITRRFGKYIDGQQ